MSLGSDLSTNFKDPILNESMNGKRRYSQINNEDGSISFDDITTYIEEGSEINASLINQLCDYINELKNNSVILIDTQSITQDIYHFEYFIYKVRNKKYMKVFGDISFDSINGTVLSPLNYGTITNLRLTPYNIDGIVVTKAHSPKFISSDCSGVLTVNQYQNLYIASGMAIIDSLSYYITSPPRAGSFHWEITCEIE